LWKFETDIFEFKKTEFQSFRVEFQTLPFDPFAQVVALLWLARLAAHPANSFSEKNREKCGFVPSVFLFSNKCNKTS